MNISYLGPEKTNTEFAARSLAKGLCADCALFPKKSLQLVATSVAEAGSDFAVMPYYNFLEGLVQQTLDLIYENELQICDVVRMPIKHFLGGDKNASEIYSHPMALAQSSDFLKESYPHAEQVILSSTAEAVRRVAESGEGAAIAAKEALDFYKLPLVAEDIGKRRHGKVNFTDFYLVTKDSALQKKDGSYLTMIAITPRTDRPGLLAQILSHVAFFGLNNSKIHSRPASDYVSLSVDPQMFYLELMTHKDDDLFRECVRSLEYALADGGEKKVVRVLGSYPFCK